MPPLNREILPKFAHQLASARQFFRRLACFSGGRPFPSRFLVGPRFASADSQGSIWPRGRILPPAGSSPAKGRRVDGRDQCQPDQSERTGDDRQHRRPRAGRAPILEAEGRGGPIRKERKSEPAWDRPGGRRDAASSEGQFGPRRTGVGRGRRDLAIWEARYSKRNFIGRIAFRGSWPPSAAGVLGLRYTWGNGHDDIERRHLARHQARSRCSGSASWSSGWSRPITATIIG